MYVVFNNKNPVGGVKGKNIEALRRGLIYGRIYQNAVIYNIWVLK